MNHSLFKACLLVIWSTLAWASGGDHGGNGAGIAENHVAFARHHLERYIDMCLVLENCRITDDERLLLRKIRSAMAVEKKSKDGLVFQSEKSDPGFFKIDGAVRIAKTGDDVGDAVYFNTDLLYNNGPLGEVEPIAFATAVSLLVHEYGHHQGIKEHLPLDLLGSKVSALLQAHMQEVAISPLMHQVKALAINFPYTYGSFTQLLVSDGEELVDLSQSLKKQVNCPTIEESEVAYLMVWNLHWMREYWDNTSKEGYNRHPLRGRLSLQCASGSRTWSRSDLDVVVDLGFNIEIGGKLKFAKGSERIRQLDCSKKPNDCH